ncbi:MAG: hypothetical protein UT00_C0033G0007 [Parcubacteria group bacterium GW2011_GWA1_38_7]|nr:MAG: hypothetical protein UT00_C0033G0007 [Parcubacteria group bacterium GW2011_GWA1_38_7]
MIPIIGISLWSILKIFILIVLALYIIFAVVVIRQVQLMTDTLEVGFEAQLRLLSFVHLLFAIAVLVFAVLIL